jgi:hypothetical protein
MRLGWVIVILVFLWGPASAQISTFDSHTIYKSAECEVGRFAIENKNLKIDPERMIVHVSWSLISERIFKGGASVGFSLPGPLKNIFSTPSIAAEGSNTSSNTRKGSKPFVIHPANAQACGIKNRAPVQVYDCLKEQIDELQNDQPAGPWKLTPGTLYCDKKVIGYGKTSANGKITVWFFNIGPSAEYDVTRTFQITIDDPPPQGNSTNNNQGTQDKKKQ